MPVLKTQKRTHCEVLFFFLLPNYVVDKASAYEKDNSDFIVLQLKCNCHLRLYYYFITLPERYNQAKIHSSKNAWLTCFNVLLC